jgi:hypothetical protein
MDPADIKCKYTYVIWILLAVGLVLLVSYKLNKYVPLVGCIMIAIALWLYSFECPSPPAPPPPPPPPAGYVYCEKPGEDGISAIYTKGPTCAWTGPLLNKLKNEIETEGIKVTDCTKDKTGECVNIGNNGALPGFPAVLCNDGETVYVGYKE